MLGLRFEISPYSFYQVNPIQAERLFGKAVERRNKAAEKTADLYCGVGNHDSLWQRRKQARVGIAIKEAKFKRKQKRGYKRNRKRHLLYR